MTQSFTDVAPAGLDAVAGGKSTAVGSQEIGSQDSGWRNRLRGRFAVGFLFLSTVTAYGAALVLFDKWYTGGSLGIF